MELQGDDLKEEGWRIQSNDQTLIKYSGQSPIAL